MEKVINNNYNNFEEPNKNNLKAVILGGSGAIGRELLKELMNSKKWSEIVVIVRRSLDDWKKLDPQKLKIIELDSLDLLENTQNWSRFANFTTMFCCLGSRVKYGKELFRKVDYTYVHYGALIAKQNGIPHFGLISSMGADKKSILLYSRTKGEIEETLKGIQFPVLSIFRPGLLVDRNNDKRWGEVILKYIPLVPKIDAKDMARAMMREAELIMERKNIEKTVEVNIYDNSQIKSLLKDIK